MSLVTRRAGARKIVVALIALAIAPVAVSPAHAELTELVALDLDEAATLAVTAQPLLKGLAAEARAARESAVAASQLPDPRLVAGVQDLPANGPNAYSFTRDPDTQLQVGVLQEFPRAEKRRLRGQSSQREAAQLDAAQQAAQRAIRRDAALAWIDLWRYDRALSLARATQREAQTQQQAVEIAFKTGRATQAEVLAARIEAARLEDAVSGAEQDVAHGRNTLSRWIGEDAQRPVCPDLPAMPPAPTLEQVLGRARQHPRLAQASAGVAAAQTQADLAKSAYQPDWRVELGYAYRPEYPEELVLRVGMDLPLFTGKRQDRGVAAALARQQAAESGVEDAGRQLESEARLNFQDWVQLDARLRQYDKDLLPQAGARIDAALNGWRSGRGSLREVLDARRSALELRMARLLLQGDYARHYIQLTYLGAFDVAADDNQEAKP